MTGWRRMVSTALVAGVVMVLASGCDGDRSEPLTSVGPTGGPSSTFWDGMDLNSVSAETMPTEP